MDGWLWTVRILFFVVLFGHFALKDSQRLSKASSCTRKPFTAKEQQDDDEQDNKLAGL